MRNWKIVGAAAIAAAIVVSVAAFGRSASAVAPGESGIVCTENSSDTFTLTARSGSVSTPDLNTMYMWSYALGSQPFQLPGPTLCVTEGDEVTIVLNNTLPEPVSIMFPGQEDVLANGAPAQPQFAGSVLTSLVQPAAAGNGSVTYTFTATQPGTYLYESGTDPAKQIQMGLFGALVVRPAMGNAYAYNRADSKFNPAAEYVFLLSEIDPALHQAVERGQPYDFTANHPRYWMINGRSFPDTIAPNFAPWLPDQPYSSLVHIKPKSVTNPDPALVRYINVGTLNHPFHPHGNHGRVIARDGVPLEGPALQDLSYEKFLVLVGSGQTWDATYDWTDVELWRPATGPTDLGNPIPVTLPSNSNILFKDNATWWSGSPYLGYQGTFPNGVTTFNECGEYYQAWHSHALNEAANYEAGFGGMFTLQRIDPPTGCP